MATTNDITGDSLVTKSSTDTYRDGWDRIFGKKRKPFKSTELKEPKPCGGCDKCKCLTKVEDDDKSKDIKSES